MIKKSIAVLTLCILLIGCGLTLFACNKNNDVNTYNPVDEKIVGESVSEQEWENLFNAENYKNVTVGYYTFFERHHNLTTNNFEKVYTTNPTSESIRVFDKNKLFVYATNFNVLEDGNMSIANEANYFKVDYKTLTRDVKSGEYKVAISDGNFAEWFQYALQEFGFDISKIDESTISFKIKNKKLFRIDCYEGQNLSNSIIYFDYGNSYIKEAEVNGLYLIKTNYDDEYGVYDYRGNEKNLTIPRTYGNTKITGIFGLPSNSAGSGIPAWSSPVESLTFYDSIKKIGVLQNHALRQINFNGSISQWAELEGSRSQMTNNIYINGTPIEEIKTIELKGISKIEPSAFAGFSALTEVSISDGVVSIGKFAFRGCSNLTSVTIPDTVTSVGVRAFNGCDNLKFNEYENGFYLGNKNNPYLVLVKAKSQEDITSCTIHNKTKVIAAGAFNGCFITNIMFDGTKAQWEAINKNYYSEYDPTSVVHCTDGDVTFYGIHS